MLVNATWLPVVRSALMIASFTSVLRRLINRHQVGGGRLLVAVCRQVGNRLELQVRVAAALRVVQENLIRAGLGTERQDVQRLPLHSERVRRVQHAFEQRDSPFRSVF